MSFPEAVTILQELSLLLTVLYFIMMFILGRYIFIRSKQMSNDTALSLLEKQFQLVSSSSKYIINRCFLVSEFGEKNLPFCHLFY